MFVYFMFVSIFPLPSNHSFLKIIKIKVWSFLIYMFVFLNTSNSFICNHTPFVSWQEKVSLKLEILVPKVEVSIHI